MTQPLLSVRDLSVAFHQGGATSIAVDHVSFDLMPGEVVALVGESGSGKSVTANSILKLLPYPAASHPSGKILFDGKDMLALPERSLRAVRGNDVTMIFQEPMTSLNPLHTIERQIGEILELHQAITGAEARARTLELLLQVGIREPEKRLKAYPHELSGGQRQRVMIAMALANRPKLLIADEPTTALDVTVQAQILELLSDLKTKHGMSMLFITHDLGIVRKFADRVCVMTKGKIVETGTVEQVFTDPQHAYTRHLLAAEPKGEPPHSDASKPVVMQGDDIKVWFPIKAGLMRRVVDHVKAVDGIDITLRAGQTVGVVGESGSGKTTLGLALSRLIASEGRISFIGQSIDHYSYEMMKPLRNRLQVVFQDPYGSLSPRMSVGEIVAEGLKVHERSLSADERDTRVAVALEEVGLDPATRWR
ncbi:ATP-binding cassette domain-containing protein, partial [Agrobacterium sp.]